MIIGSQAISPYCGKPKAPSPLYLMLKQSIIRGSIPLLTLQNEIKAWMPSQLADFWNGSSFPPLNYNPGNNEFPQITGQFGSIFTFAKKLTDSTLRKTYFMMYAQGGTRIFPDPAKVDWSPTTDELLASAITEVRQAKREKNLAPPVVIWGMGINDARDLDAANFYEQGLNDVFDTLVSELNVERFLLQATHNSLPVLTYPHSAIIQAAEIAVAASRSDTTLFSAAGLQVAGDNVHLTQVGGYRVMGEAFADHEISLIP